MATNLVVGHEGEIALPIDVRERYGLVPKSPVRMVETRTGILLIPLTSDPMSLALQQELEEWQAGTTEAWALFPYDETQQ